MSVFGDNQETSKIRECKAVAENKDMLTDLQTFRQ